MISFRKIASSMFIVLFAIAMISTVSLQNNVYAESGFSVTASASEGSGTISVDGYTASGSGVPVTLIVSAPNGNVVAVDQFNPDSSGTFSTDIGVGGQMWSQDGTYTVSVTTGTGSLYSASLDVDISDGVTADTSVTVDNTTTKVDTDDGYWKDDGYYTSTSPSGLEISADAIEGSTTITINGSTDRISDAVTLKVTAPNGNIVSADQISPNNDGTFSTDIGVGGPMWSQDGLYTVSAQQGDSDLYKSSVEVDIADGAVVPEFGTIAMMILVVSIASIIVLSAKGRLSITPKL